MKPGARGPAALLGLGEYYVLEGLNSFGTNVFFLGIYFHARIGHGFSNTANLLLAAVQGAAYVAATRAGGRLADGKGVDRSIACGLAGMILALAVGWTIRPAWGLFLAMGLYSASTALTWPAFEAAIARAPGVVPLARRAGLYNVIWSFVGAAGFFLSGPLFALDQDTVFWAPMAAHALQLAGLAAAGAHFHRASRDGGTQDPPGVARGGLQRVQHSAHGAAPQRQDPEGHPPGAGTRLTPEAHAKYLKSAWVANGLGYFIFGAFTALAPALGERLGLGPRLAIWLVSSYLFARSAAFLLFWRWAGWEYHAVWLAAALALPPAAFAALFVAPTTVLAIAALTLLGALSGLAYSASLHASLDRVGAEGEGGGQHEWVIGLGVLLGPLAGAAGVRFIGGLAGAGALVTALAACAALAGLLRLGRKTP